jgi:hypothetical protein
MIDHRQQNGGRQMIAAANHHDRIQFGQLGQRTVRIRRLRMIDQYNANVFTWHLPDGLAVALKNELLVPNRKMSRFPADFERAFDHFRGPARRNETEPSVELPNFASCEVDLSIHAGLVNS